MQRLLKSLALAAVLLGSLALAAPACTVTSFSKTGFVIGAKTFNDGFTVPVDGEYKAVIRDFTTPEPFDTLLFAVTTTSPLGLVGFADGANGTGVFTFTATAGVNYFASIAAITGESHIGLFGAQICLIPIPPSLLLLGSGLLGLVVMRRRRS